MEKEFTRKELYDLVWSQPMKALAADIGISDVALAKNCRKANIPVPGRGYWARKQAGQRVTPIALPPRFFGASDRIGGSTNRYYWGSDWPEKFLNAPVPPEPIFDENLPRVSERAQKLVGKVRYPRKFDPVHPLVAKLLAQDEERREQFLKWDSSYYAPKYDVGIERRRLLIINALFLAAVGIGCRPSMSTSKYSQDYSTERRISIAIGQSGVSFTIERYPTKKESKAERLRLAFSEGPNKSNAAISWEDNDEYSIDERLSEILVSMLVHAETAYRESLASHREWIIKRKIAAEEEIKRRKEEAERKAKEAREKLERENIGRLLSQANALDRANRIRTYVKAARLRASEMIIPLEQFDKWANWANGEADRIDPLKNGLLNNIVGKSEVDGT